MKILKEIIKLRKQDDEEHETLLDVYMRAMDDEGAKSAAKAA